MDTENNSLINTFKLGMNTDSSVDNVKDGCYRLAKNIRVLHSSNDSDGNNGIIKPISGIGNYKYLNDDVYRVLASTHIRQYGVIIYISKRDNETAQLCVATFIHKSKNEISDIKRIFKSDIIDWPEDESLWPKRVSVTSEYESENNIKLYIATGFNPIICINIAKLYNENITIDDVSLYPKITFTKPKFNKYISGELLPGIVRYSYLLYQYHGTCTDISPACLGIPVINIINDLNNSTYAINGVQYGKKTSCGILISINLENIINKLFDRIKIFRITTYVNGLAPAIEVVYDNQINLDSSSNFIFNDTGLLAIDSISIEEYNSITGVHIVPNSIDAKNNILFAANIKLTQTQIDKNLFINWDSRSFRAGEDKSIALKSFNDESILYLHWDDVINSLISKSLYNPYNDINIYKPSNCCKYDKDEYYGGTGKNVSWRFIITFNTADSSKISGLCKEIGTETNYINRKNKNNTSETYFVHKTDGLIKATETTSDEIGRLQNQWITKSLRRNELYRYGIILYDKYGQASPVKWIDDIRTPHLSEDYFNTFISHYKQSDGKAVDLATIPLGIAFKVDNLPDGCTAYEIVRCKRSEADIATVALGVISKPIVEYLCKNTGKAGNKIHFPTGLLTTATVVLGSEERVLQENFDETDGNGFITAARNLLTNINNSNLYLFVSAEICYLSESMKTIFGNKDYKLLPLRYIYGSNGTEYIGKCNNWEYVDPKVTDPYANIKLDDYIYYLRPGISNCNFMLGRYDYKLYNKDSSAKGAKFYTSDYWIRMITPLIKYIYYESKISDAYESGKLYYSTLGVKDNEYTGKKKNQIDTKVFSYIKLYELAYKTKYRIYSDNEGGYNDTVTNDRNISDNDLSVNIKNIELASDLKWNEIIKTTFLEKGSNSLTKDNGRWWPELEYLNHIDSAGSYQFCNAVFYGMNGTQVDAGGEVGDDGYTIAADVINDLDKLAFNNSWTNICNFPYSTGGRCALLELDNKNSVGFELGATLYYINKNNALDIKTAGEGYHDGVFANSMLGTSLCNIRKNVIPYGGFSQNAIDSSVYYSNGLYFTESGVWKPVFDGDVYISVLDYTSMHKAPTHITKTTDDSSIRKIEDYRTNSMMLGYAIPVESTINCIFSHGFEFSKNCNSEAPTFIQVEPSNVEKLYTQTKPEYAFNTAYASEDTLRVHAAFDLSNIDDFNKHNDNRVYYSLLKEQDERMESWSKFLSSNFIDVDSKYGAITNLKTFNNALVFWQRKSVGILSVNERSLTTDSNSNNLILGTGGILDRYDYLDTTSGMHDQLFCAQNTKNSLYWYDYDNTNIKSMQGQLITTISKVYNVNNIVLSLSDITDNASPVVMCDYNNNEVLFKALKLDLSISFSDIAQLFYSIYTIPIHDAVSFSDSMFAIYKDKDYLKVAQWDANNNVTTTWDNKYESAYIEYVVNKIPTQTKVFDNLEIVSKTLPTDNTYFLKNCTYKWYTDLHSTESNMSNAITSREGNFRYSIPRADGNALFGSRIRGKYMVCSINNTKPNTNTDIMYIITKFRASCS